MKQGPQRDALRIPTGELRTPIDPKPEGEVGRGGAQTCEQSRAVPRLGDKRGLDHLDPGRLCVNGGAVRAIHRVLMRDGLGDLRPAARAPLGGQPYQSDRLKCFDDTEP